MAKASKSIDEGIALLNRIAAFATPDEAKAGLVLCKGEFLSMRGETNAAELCLREALDNPALEDRPWDDTIRWLRLVLCEAYTRAGDKDAVVTQLRETLDQIGWECMAHIVAHVGCTDEAVEMLRDMDATPMAYVILAEGMWRYGDFGRAKNVLADIPQTAIDADSKLKEGIWAVKRKMAKECGKFAEEFEELAQKAEAVGNEALAKGYLRLAKPYRQEEAQLLEEAK